MQYFNEALAVELEHVGHPLLSKLYRECKDKKNMCFKRCGNVIVGMQLDPDKRSTLNRSGIVDQRYAKFRSERMSNVIFLYDAKHRETLDYWGHMYNQFFIWYKKDEPAVPNSFFANVELICAPGIHFYLTLEAALTHLQSIGSNRHWNDNGQLWGYITNPPTATEIANCIEPPLAID